MITKNFQVNYTKKTSLDELLNEGKSFKEINDIMKNSIDDFTIQEVINGIPPLSCMFKEFLEDEASGNICNIETFKEAYDTYFGMFGWYQSELQENGGDLTTKDILDDLDILADYLLQFEDFKILVF